MGFVLKPTFVFVKRDDVFLGKIEEAVKPLALSAALKTDTELYDIEYKKEGKDYYLRISPRHFEKYTGSRVEVKLFKSENGKKSFCGELRGYNGGDVSLKQADGNEITVEKEKYMYVRLYPDI